MKKNEIKNNITSNSKDDEMFSNFKRVLHLTILYIQYKFRKHEGQHCNIIQRYKV